MMKEIVSDIQHEIWSSWMRWLFHVSIENDDGTVTIPADKVARWKRQMNTPYMELSEDEKDGDRHQADLILRVL